MKSYKRSFLIVLLLSLIIVPILDSNKEVVEAKTTKVTKSSGKYKVTSKSLNVRTGSSASHKKVGVLKKNKTITVNGKTTNGWYRFKYKGKNRFVSGKYIKKVTSKKSPGISVSKASGKYKVTVNSLNIRTGNSAKYKKVGVLRKNKTITVNGVTKNGWYRFKHNGKNAYVSGKYLKKQTQKLMYAKRNTKMYWYTDVKRGHMYEIPKNYAVVYKATKTINKVKWYKIEHYNYDGWMKAKDLQTKKPNIKNKYNVKHLNQGKKGYTSLRMKARIHNSVYDTNKFMDQHRKVLESKGVKFNSYLKKYPVKIEVMDLKNLKFGGGGEYFVKGVHHKDAKIRIGTNMKYGNVSKNTVVHEFGHHVGYTVGHVNNNFNEFGKYKNLNKKIKDDWGNRNIEKYADTHTEAYVKGFKNRTAAGNFSNTSKKNAFINWEVKKMNAPKN